MPNNHVDSSSQSKKLGSTPWRMAFGYIIVTCKRCDVLEGVSHNSHTGREYDKDRRAYGIH